MNITESNSMLDFYWATDQTPLFLLSAESANITTPPRWTSLSSPIHFSLSSLALPLSIDQIGLWWIKDNMASASTTQQEAAKMDQNQFRRMIEKFGNQKWLLYGAVSGGISRTATAPLERLKVLNQVTHPICNLLSSNKTKQNKISGNCKLSLERVFFQSHLGAAHGQNWATLCRSDACASQDLVGRRFQVYVVDVRPIYIYISNMHS